MRSHNHLTSRHFHLRTAHLLYSFPRTVVPTAIHTLVDSLVDWLNRVLSQKAGAGRFLIGHDLNIELGFVCMDEDDEMKDIFGPQCCHRLDADPGGLKKTLWLDVMKGFNCKAVSTLSSCDDRTEKSLSHKAWS